MRLSVFRWDDTRPALTRVRRLLTQTRALLALPAEVRRFYLKALRTAWRNGDQYSFDVVTRPDDLAEILRLADDADSVVELGTATAWTTIALALARSSRRVTTYDPEERNERELYLQLVRQDVRDRITFLHDVGRSGPRSDELVEFLFVDGSHERDDTVLTFEAWSDSVAPGGRIVFHDYLDPNYHGVTEAIQQLRLDGYQSKRLFVWTRA